MLNVALIIVALILIMPYSLKTVIKNFWMVFVLLFAAAIIILSTKADNKSTITITATGEYNESAEGSEIWITQVDIDGVAYKPREVFANGWIDKDGYVIWNNQVDGISNKISTSIERGSEITIHFMANKWRGIADVTLDGNTTRIDTFLQTEDDDQGVKVSERNNRGDTNRLIAPLILISIFCVLVLISKFLNNSNRNSTEKQLLKQSNNREEWLDVLKIISTFLIVVIHASGEIYNVTPQIGVSWMAALTMNLLPRCAVPLFIMISGMLMIKQPQSINKAIKKSITAAGALIFWSVLYILFQTLIWHSGESIVSQVILIPIKRGPSGHLWYGYLLIWIYLFSPIISSLYYSLNTQMRKYFLLLSLLIPGVISYIIKILQIQNTTNPVIEYGLYMSISYMGLMILGKMIKEKELHIKSLLAGVIVIVSIAATYASVIYLSLKVGESQHVFFGELSVFNIAFASGIAIIFANTQDGIKSVLDKSKLAITHLSEDGLGIYYVHVLWLWIINEILPRLGFNRASDGCLSTMVHIIFAYIISIITVEIIRKIPILNKVV